uniref:Uncharacterized protein n=1 Tax=Arundo donax TaxID=35708 RepID=A0A0A9E7X2_ARUDO
MLQASCFLNFRLSVAEIT